MKMKIPLSTYRIQFTPSFRFADAQKMVSYLRDLGISTLYASPILKSKTGSQHGYDQIDFGKINPRLGGEKDFYPLVKKIKEKEMGWLQDIVPNHMAYHPSNPFIYDLLEKGVRSAYANYFDIDWQPHIEELKDKVLFPFLEKPLTDCLCENRIQLLWEKGNFLLGYHEIRLPLSYPNPQWIFSLWNKKYPAKTPFPHIQTEKEQGAITRLLAQVNQTPASIQTLSFWQVLLSHQNYLPSYWKEARKKINYRRFFSINELICLKAEDKSVFDATHLRIFEEIAKGNISGIRVDHLDGLFDPGQYLERLKKQIPHTYTVVEKILQPGEYLPKVFAAEGNTGYDFLYYLNHLFCQKENRAAFMDIYQSFIGQKSDISRLLLKKKKLILRQQMYGDLKNLAQLFYQHYRLDPKNSHPMLQQKKMNLALQEIMIRLPVYRTYISPSRIESKDINLLTTAITRAKQNYPTLHAELDYFLEGIIQPLSDSRIPLKDKNKALQLLMRWQQFTGPLMAKGIEDTFLYCYYPLLSLNEVGTQPGNFGISKNTFYRFIQKRKEEFPYSMNATMTHDSKRGEDVRARINVLSEIPKKWQEKLYNWHQLNLSQKKKIHSLVFPDPNMEYFLYQTLIGTLPFSGLSGINQSYLQKIQQYLVKSAREAKIYTSWATPYLPYEEALTSFITHILEQQKVKENLFLADLLDFAKTISHYGMLNSLSQVLLKTTCPGVTDFYQGSELWDLRLVDPDNRRPVDYDLRTSYLEMISQRQKQDPLAFLKELLASPADGKIKLFLVHQLLQLKNKEPGLFLDGNFIPIVVSGKYQNHIISYLRTYQNHSILTVAPRFYCPLVKEGDYPLGTNTWQDTTLTLNLPVSCEQQAIEWISQQPVIIKNKIPVGEILQHFPMAVILIG